MVIGCPRAAVAVNDDGHDGGECWRIILVDYGGGQGMG